MGILLSCAIAATYDIVFLRFTRKQQILDIEVFATIRFFANYAKTEEFGASELPCVPINSTIAVILNPILRYLRPSGAEISIYKFTRSRDHLNRENEILHHYLKLWHQLFWIQHHKIDQKTLRTAGALEMHTKLSGLPEYTAQFKFLKFKRS